MRAQRTPERIEFTVTADDVVDITRAYAQYRSRSGQIVGALMVAAGILGWWLMDDWYWLLLIPIGAVALGSGYLRVVDRAFARAQPQTGIGTACLMEFTSRGLRFRQGGIDGVIEWNAVTEIRDGEGVILLLADRRILASIPKRVFENQQQVETARLFLAYEVAAATGGKATA